MINAGTALVVKPHISGEGRILLELSPKKESYTMVEGQPVINEQAQPQMSLYQTEKPLLSPD
jgi:type II secretory pathway component GspD/PulD (secretin)